MPRHTRRYYRPHRYQSDESPAERARRAAARRAQEISSKQLVFYIIVGLLPIGVPILAVAFRPMAGLGPNLSIVWAVLAGMALLAMNMLTVFVIPARQYLKNSFLVFWTCLGYLLFLVLFGIRMTMVMGWTTAESDEGRFSVTVPTDVRWKQIDEGSDAEHFDLTFGSFRYVAGFRDLNFDDRDTVARAINRSHLISDPFRTVTERTTDGRERERPAPLQLGEQMSGSTGLSVSGYPGRRFIRQGDFVIDIYLADSRLYYVAIKGPATNPRSFVVKKYLASFHIDRPEEQY